MLRGHSAIPKLRDRHENQPLVSKSFSKKKSQQQYFTTLALPLPIANYSSLQTSHCCLPTLQIAYCLLPIPVSFQLINSNFHLNYFSTKIAIARHFSILSFIDSFQPPSKPLTNDYQNLPK
jgi:hypothetical protein